MCSFSTEVKLWRIFGWDNHIWSWDIGQSSGATDWMKHSIAYDSGKKSEEILVGNLPEGYEPLSHYPHSPSHD